MKSGVRAVVVVCVALAINVLGLFVLTGLSNVREEQDATVEPAPVTRAPTVAAPPRRDPPPEPPRPTEASAGAPASVAPAPPQLPSFSTMTSSTSVPVRVAPMARADLDALFSDLSRAPADGATGDGLFDRGGSGGDDEARVRDAGEVERAPVVRRRAAATYPLAAERAGTTGYVVVRGLVETDGSVSRVDVLEASPPGVCDDAARDALARWSFEPGRDRGRAVRVWVTTRLEFDLR